MTITEIHICDEASYSSEGAKLCDLAKVNYVYGANGSGKTTISRVIANPSNYSSCSINPRETGCQAFVYNRDFVKDHFNPDKKLKGIFTLGDGNDQIIQSIEDKKAIETRLLSGKENLTNALAAKRDEEVVLEKGFEDYCWEFKKKYDESFKDAFTGLRNSASKFKEKFLQEAQTNNSELISHEKLVERAKTVFSHNQIKELIHPLPDASNLIKIESLDALARKIIGKRDVDIAAMIERLSNSDWVKEGRQYLRGNNDHCPFCQKEINAAFTKSLEEYFDDNFENGVSNLRTIATNYEAYSSSIIAQMNDILAKANRFLDATTLKQFCDALETKTRANKMRLGQKLKEPSTIIALEAVNEIISHISELISEANQKASEHNRLIDNISSEKKSLIGCVWHFVLSEANIGYTEYQQKSTGLKRGIQNIETKLSANEQDIKNNTGQLQDLERSITSVQPTIDKINGLLASFGFTNFKLTKAEKEGFYQIIRGDGVDVGDTLSEGEKSFITFLYFYHLIKEGSSSESGTVSDRIVVIDDPVSSLDSDVLFIVSNLIKGLIKDIHKNIGHIKQVFILTHNVYFFKEITYSKDNKKRNRPPLPFEAFWVAKKINGKSTLTLQPENPIKSSYEMLWDEIRNPHCSPQAIQNTLRRIVEHYFRILGGVDDEKIIAMFEGGEKIICGSLFSWINDGSHDVNDDLFMTCDASTIDAYLCVFKKIFEHSKHGAHYKMMMKIAEDEIMDNSDTSQEDMAA